MNITFFGTTLQIVVRVVCTYLLVDLLGLDAVALATGLGWVVIVLFHSTVYLAGVPGQLATAAGKQKNIKKSPGDGSGRPSGGFSCVKKNPAALSGGRE